MDTASGSLVIYSPEEGRTLEVRLQGETVWLTLNQIADLFGIDKSGVSRHLKHIYQSGELPSEGTVAKIATVQQEGSRQVRRTVEHYNLDTVISVGYRANSRRATAFRIWANRVLRDYLVQGFSINAQRLQERGWAELDRALALVRSNLPARLSGDEAEGLLEIIRSYAKTWLLLRAYDERTLAAPERQRPEEWVAAYAELRSVIGELRAELARRGEASELFGLERGQMLGAILGSLYQTYDGRELYGSVEEKAAHLLYLVIKDHPFVDGNKRIGTYLFLVYLDRNRCLFTEAGVPKFTDSALVALALLVAESRPEQKRELVTLVMHFVRNA